MMKIFFFFFLLFFLNQFSFIFYNYSWFSLLCSTYVIDFYNLFHFLLFDLHYYLLFLDCIIFFYSNNVIVVLNRWQNQILTYINTIKVDFLLSFKLMSLVNEVDTIYCLYFDTKVIGSSNIYFYILQNKLFILPGETTLSFFRVYNENIFPISGITIYSITPFEFQSFLNKIQCFCFEEIVVHGFEIIELPVLFYLDTNILYLNSIQLKELCIEYVLLCSKVA